MRYINLILARLVVDKFKSKYSKVLSISEIMEITNCLFSIVNKENYSSKDLFKKLFRIFIYNDDHYFITFINTYSGLIYFKYVMDVLRKVNKEKNDIDFLISTQK